jgi:hypothetical protein
LEGAGGIGGALGGDTLMSTSSAGIAKFFMAGAVQGGISEILYGTYREIKENKGNFKKYDMWKVTQDYTVNGTTAGLGGLVLRSDKGLKAIFVTGIYHGRYNDYYYGHDSPRNNPDPLRGQGKYIDWPDELSL